MLSRFDPRARIASGFLLVLVSALTGSLASAGASLALAAAASIALYPDKKVLARRLAAVNAFLLFIWASVPFTVPGTPVAGSGAFSLTREGLFLSLLVTLKGNAAFLWFMASMGSMPLSDFARGLTGLKFPGKLVTLLLRSFRQVSVFSLACHDRRGSAKLRGFTPRTDRRTYETLASFVAILFLRAFERSRVMPDALRLRGFTGEWPELARPPLGARDAVPVFLSAAAAALIAAASLAL